LFGSVLEQNILKIEYLYTFSQKNTLVSSWIWFERVLCYRFELVFVRARR